MPIFILFKENSRCIEVPFPSHKYGLPLTISNLYHIIIYIMYDTQFWYSLNLFVEIITNKPQ